MYFILKPADLPYWLTCLFAVLSVLLVVFLRANSRYLKFREFSGEKIKGNVLGLEQIPGPKPFLGLKLFGNLLEFLPFSNTLPTTVKWSWKYPNIMRGSAINKSVVGLISPNVIHQLFKSSDLGHVVKSPIIYNLKKPFINNGVLVSKYKFWQHQRKILRKTQSFQNLKAYTEMLNRHSKDFVKILENVFQDGNFHQINDLICVLFLNIICEMITGNKSIPVNETQRYHHNFQIWKKSVTTRLLYPWLMLDFVWYLHPLSKLQGNAILEMLDFARKRIEEHKKANDKIKENKETLPDSLFRSMLDELVDAGVENNQIIEEVNTVIFGGHETGAATIHFFCLMMALNPKMQKSCQEEIDEVFKNMDTDDKKRNILFEDATSGLKYLERCIQETLRLYPPAFAFFREIETSLIIESEGKSYVLPARTNVAIIPFATHRNLKDYPDPEKFDPDRFLPQNVAQRHSCSFIPFSGGIRSCLAPKFAMMELKVVAAYILHNFEISTSTQIENVKLLPFVSLTPDKDFDFHFSKRA